MMGVEHSSETDSLAYEEWAKERRDPTNVNYVETGCIIWHSILLQTFKVLLTKSSTEGVQGK